MSTFFIINIIIFISICFEFVYFLIFYFLVRSDIRILINAKSIDELDKWALKYARKYNFNKDAILGNIYKTVESGSKVKKMGRWLFLIGTIFTVMYFILRVPDIIRFGEEIVFSGQHSMVIFDELMIYVFISSLWAVFFFNLIHKRNIVACDQFSRLL